MPIYKMDGKKDGLQKYRVRINFIDSSGNSKQIDRIAYGKDAAKELERELFVELNAKPTYHKITLQELYDEYINVKQYEIRESTLNKFKQSFRIYILPELSAQRIDKLNTSLLQKWKTSVEKYTTSKHKRLSLKYKKNIYGDFRSLLNYAVKMEYIVRNPLLIVGNFKSAYEEKKEINYYTIDDFLKFISTAKTKAEEYEKSRHKINEWNYYVFFNIAFYTGMRKGEIYALKWSDITNNTIYIKRSINQKLKGGDRETPPKNINSIRSIQIPKPLIQILDEHYLRYKQFSYFSDDWRICGGIKCIRDSTLENRNKMYAQLAEVKKIRIHDFRHTHATVLVNNGINIQEIARRLGHSNVEITWKIYAHLYPQEEERALKILDNIK